MAYVRTKASKFRRPCSGFHFGGDAEPDAAVGFFLMPSKPCTPRSISTPAAAPYPLVTPPDGKTRRFPPFYPK